MFNDLLKNGYQKSNRHFANFEFKGHLREYMIDLNVVEEMKQYKKKQKRK